MELASNEPFSVEDCIVRVTGHLVLGGIANEALTVSEGDVRWRCAIALVVSNNLDFIIKPDPYTGVGGS
jgi:hypothetical protein